MKLLITGGAGFIGARLTRALLAKGQLAGKAIDNIVMIAVIAGSLPPAQQRQARLIGLSIALITRLALLGAISWIAGLVQPLFAVAGQSFSGRDLILLLGGLFLIGKSVVEVHEKLEGADGRDGLGGRQGPGGQPGRELAGETAYESLRVRTRYWLEGSRRAG